MTQIPHDITNIHHADYMDVFPTEENFHQYPNQMIRCLIERNYNYDLHRQHFYEMNIVTRGRGIHYYCNQQFETSVGDVFVIMPNIPHGYRNIDNLDVFHLLIHPQFLQRYKQDLQEIPGVYSLFYIAPQLRVTLGLPMFWHIPEKMHTSLKKAIGQLFELCDHVERPADHLQVHYEVLRLLIFLANTTEHKNVEHTYGKILDTLEYIHLHYNEPLNIVNLAEYVQMSRGAFCTNFRKSIGQTPAEYIAQHRIMRACNFLLNSNLSITDIAMQCGYYDAAHLSKHFRKYKGMTPMEYRKNAIRDKSSSEE